MNYSQSELEYIKSNILKGVRPDLRNIYTSRVLNINPFLNTQADRSFEIRLLQSHIILSVQFTEEIYNQHINSNFILPEILKNCLIPTLQQYNLGMNIYLDVVNDDGNIIYMFFAGLKHMLQNIYVPDINNLDKDVIVSFDVPEIYTFAIFNDVKKDIFIIDPIKIEEESCDILLNVFCKNNLFSIVTYKSNYISKNVIDEIFLHINNII